MGTHAEGNEQASAYTDLAYLTQFCDGNKEKMKKYIGVYVNSVAGFVNKLKAAMDANDMEGIALQVHSFHPKWMLMGMKQSTALGHATEKQCREQCDIEKVKENIAILIHQAECGVKELSVLN